jgi:hydroxymethylbilane synthase
LSDRIKSYFDPDVYTPAAAQGIMCIECRGDDYAVKNLLAPLHHKITAYSAIAERSMNLHLQGGCQVPIGAYATLNKDKLHLQGLVGKPDGSLLLRAEAVTHKDNAKALGIQVAEDLLAQGAETILKEVYQQHG